MYMLPPFLFLCLSEPSLEAWTVEYFTDYAAIDEYIWINISFLRYSAVYSSGYNRGEGTKA